MIQRDITKGLDFNEGEFDLSFVASVLMHIPPEEIEKTLKDILRISKRYVIICEQFHDFKDSSLYRRSQDKQSSYYTFEHNYKLLLKALGYEKLVFYTFSGIAIIIVRLS